MWNVLAPFIVFPLALVGLYFGWRLLAVDQAQSAKFRQIQGDGFWSGRLTGLKSDRTNYEVSSGIRLSKDGKTIESQSAISTNALHRIYPR